jgi:hypothetical protein
MRTTGRMKYVKASVIKEGRGKMFKVQGSRFKVQGSRFKVLCSMFKKPGKSEMGK